MFVISDVTMLGMFHSNYENVFLISTILIVFLKLSFTLNSYNWGRKNAREIKTALITRNMQIKTTKKKNAFDNFVIEKRAFICLKSNGNNKNGGSKINLSLNIHGDIWLMKSYDHDLTPQPWDLLLEIKQVIVIYDVMPLNAGDVEEHVHPGQIGRLRWKVSNIPVESRELLFQKILYCILLDSLIPGWEFW